MFDTVLFDLDGTLTGSFEDISNSVIMRACVSSCLK